MSAAELSAVWSREWPTHPRPSAADVLARIRSDLGTDAVTFLRCSGCGFEFSVPRGAWTADNYPAQSHGLGYDHEQALADLAGRPRGSLLEIGCGCGEFLERATALGHRPIGLDFSRSSVAAARAKGQDARDLSIAALSSMADRPDTFDAVALFQVIEHLEDPDAVFSDLRTVIRSGTRLYVGCPNPDRFTRRVRHAQRVGSSDYWDFPPQHPLRWTAPALTAFLGRHGWAVERASAEPYHPVAAAAVLTAIDGIAAGWYPSRVRRAIETGRRRVRLALAARGATGIRLYVQARYQG